jgi:glutamate racemase
MNNNPIGVFDSGMGGLSVWRVLREQLPHESLLYFGDGARCPYGARPHEEVLRFTVESVEKMLSHGCKMIVLACNTATAVAVEHLRAQYPAVPFVGLEPAVKPAVLSTESGVVGVLATRRSLDGELFCRTSAKYADRARILPVVGEGFVEIVEQSRESEPETEETVRRVIEPIIDAGADRIVLGCTHYPFLREVIERIIGERPVVIVDSADAVERRVEYLLDEHNLRADENHAPSYAFMSEAGEPYINALRTKVGLCEGK